MSQDFPAGPVVKTPRFNCRMHGFEPWSGLQCSALQPKKKKKKKKKKKS